MVKFMRYMLFSPGKRLRLVSRRHTAKKDKKIHALRRGSFLSLPLTVALLLTIEDQIVHIHDVVVQHSALVLLSFF